MPDFPQDSITPLFVSSVGMFAADTQKNSNTSYTFASTTWGTANQARYMPFVLPWPYTVRRVFWGNGSVASGNMDFGIYSLDGAKIYSTGSTGQSGASAIQYVTPTAFVLPAGPYFMALVNDGTTNRGWGTTLTGTASGHMGGMYMQASALPLPDPATFTAYTGTTYFLCGITRTASGF